MAQVQPAEHRAAPWQLSRAGLIVLTLVAVGLLAAGWPIFGWGLRALAGGWLALLAVPALLLLPGLALLRWLWPTTLAFSERWPLAIGLSCALPPLLLLASAALGLRWNAWLAWLYLGLSTLALLWPRGQKTRDTRHETRDDAHLISPVSYLLSHVSGLRSPVFLARQRHDLALIGITLLALLVRLYTARDLPAGMWGDSYHHTMIAQLLIEHGGLFDSWQPYAELTSLSYHFGFHSLVAWLGWLSGIPAISGLLIIGQVQSALVVPMIYLLTRRLTGNPRAALWAALLAGFASIMPAYYLNWGRYTQLAGQTILPAACVAWAALLAAGVNWAEDGRPGAEDRGRKTENRRRKTEDRGPKTEDGRPTTNNRPADRRDILRLYRPPSAVVRLLLLAALLTAGLALTHYRVAIFAACFVLAYALYLAFVRVRSWRILAGLAGAGLAGAALSGLLFAPWLLHIRSGPLARIGVAFASSNIGAETNALPAAESLWKLYLQPELLVAALLGVGVLLWQRNWRGLVLPVWAGLVLLAANPALIGLYGAGLISNFAALVAIYLVLAPLGGVAIAGLLALVDRLLPLIASQLGFVTKSQGHKDSIAKRLSETLPPGHQNAKHAPALARFAGLYAFVPSCLRGKHAFQTASKLSVPAVAKNGLQPLLGAGLLAWGLATQPALLAPEYQLYTPADAAAVAWLRRETPADSKVFVNSFTAFGGSLYAGSDGGWWLPFTSGHTTNLPPILYGSESGPSANYVQTIKTLNDTILAHPLASPEAAAALRAAGFSYIYDGPATSARSEPATPATLAGSPAYEQVYRQGGVTIWKIR